MKHWIVLALLGAAFSGGADAAGIYSDERIEAAINCMSAKVPPADYQTLAHGLFSPKGTIRLVGDKPVCVSRYSDDYRAKARSAADAYLEQLFASCQASGMRNLIAYRYDIEQKLAYRLAERDRAFAGIAADALDASRVCD